jgi:cytochrome c biogenesis protein CcdA
MTTPRTPYPRTEEESMKVMTAPVASPQVRRRGWVVAGAVLAGALLAYAWSAEFVDREIGLTVADSMLGHDAGGTVIAGSLAGALFAVVSGLAGTVTACNVAVFGALPAVAGGAATRRARMRAVLTSLGWFGAGLMGVAAGYGVLAVALGPGMPQLSTATVGSGMPVRLVQSVVVFGLVGLAFGYLGLAALALVPDPFAARPRLRLVVLGVLVGAFLVGRPYPLFFKLLGFAVESGNPAYGALTMMLQAFGTIVVFAALALLLTAGLGERVARWLTHPPRAALAGGVALLLLGAFLVLYWDVRLPARFGYGWFPAAPWNS